MSDFRGVIFQASISVDRRLRETGSFTISNTGMRRPRNMQTPETKEVVLDRIGVVPSSSTRADIGLCYNTMWRILPDEGMQPFRMQKVQYLNVDDYPHRRDFMRWMLLMRRVIRTFLP